MINGIQFQKGMSLTDFIAQYGTEMQCEAALIRARWPDGFVCPRCGHRHAYEFQHSKNKVWQCCACPHQTSLRAGTIMAHSRLSLRTWLLAIYLITQSKTNIAALALRRQLGISWKAAWLLKHKIMEAMLQRESNRPLSGEVRVDDAYLGGERTGGKVGRGSENKVAFVAAVELHGDHPWRVRFDPVANFSYAALKPWAACALSGCCHVVSDGLLGFGVLSQLGHHHEVMIAPKGKAGTEIEPFRWLNTLLGNLKTALGGTHHAFKFAKYADRYLADVQYRFNQRMSLPDLVPRLAFAVMHTLPKSRHTITRDPEVGT